MPKQQQSGSIIWSAICRNDVILAEAGEDSHDGAVIELAQKLLEKKPTAGWECEFPTIILNTIKHDFAG